MLKGSPGFLAGMSMGLTSVPSMEMMVMSWSSIQNLKFHMMAVFKTRRR